jgi:hypothetical protein
MAVMIFDKSVLERAQEIKRRAENNIDSTEDIQKRIKTGNAIGDEEGQMLIIPNLPTNCKVVYSIEEQPQPMGLCHHFSFSFIDRPRSSPQPALVEQIIGLFGVKQRVPFECVPYEMDNVLNLLFQVRPGELNNAMPASAYGQPNFIKALREKPNEDV